MRLRDIILLLLLGAGLFACNEQAAEPLPTLIPTIVLEAAPESDLPATAVSPTPAQTPTPVEYTPIYKTTDCQEMLGIEISPDVNIECGFVIVPEDRLASASDTVSVAVARIFSHNPANNAAPLLFLPGGPGSPALDYLSNYYTQLAVPLQDERDVILFDPRGVGLSEPEMDCWGLKLTYLRDLAETFTDAERTEKYQTALFNCKERLEEDGANLAAYHSQSIAADVKDILQVLGYEKAHLFGVSYGTRLAQQIMQDYPELVETAVLDSVVPMSTQMITQTATWPDEARQSLFATCASQPACQASYPNLEAVYQSLQTSMLENPVPLSFTDPVLGNEIEIMATPATLDAALQWALPNPYLSPFIPQMLYELQAGDGTLLTAAIGLPLLTYEDISLGMMLSVLCHDQVSSLTAEQLVAGPESYPQLSILNMVAAYDNGRFLRDMCRQWGALAPELVVPQPVQSDIPTLILAGQLDTTTPPAFGQHVAQTLSRSYFIELPDQGHVPSFGPASDCLQEMIQAFWQQPAQVPTYTCQVEQTQTAFFVAYDGSVEIALTPFTADELPFTVMVPAAWEPGASNHFYWLRFQGDVAQIAVQASPVSVAEWLDFLVENYVSSGLAEYPRYQEEITVNGRTWQIYSATFENHPVTFAFAQEAGMTFHAALASSPSEHEALFTNLLLPVLASITPK